MRHEKMGIAGGWVKAVALVVLAFFLAAGLFLYAWVWRWPVAPERVRFASGEIELAGALLLPEGEGPHPTIVMIHGAGCGTHDRIVYRQHANYLVPRGFAVLSYDKRGCGESGGDYDAAELPDLAGDARAAVRYLRGRPEIKNGAIGLWAASQGGWFAPEVAVEEEGVGFVVNRSAPSLRWDETVLFEIENELRAEGIEEREIERALALRARMWSYYRRAATDVVFAAGSERQALEAELAAVRERSWHEYFPPRLPPYEPERYAAWSGTLFYDPAPWLERLEVPLLAVFGETDVNVPAERSAAYLRRLGEDPRRRFTVVVFEGVGHQLQGWRNPQRLGFLYLDETVDWIRREVPATTGAGRR